MFRLPIARALLVGCVTLTHAGLLAAAEPSGEELARNWPRWRGPFDNGAGLTKSLPAKWSDSENILWKAELPGKGCSTPIVWEDQILLTSPIDGNDAVIAFDWNGERIWQTVVGPERAGKHRNGSGSNASPTTDGEHVFVYFKSGNLAVLDLAGSMIWKTNLQERFAKDTLYWDLGTSPVLTRDAVVVAVMQSSNSYLVAFEKKTGELMWKVDRKYPTPPEGDHSYATPWIVERDGKEIIVVWGAEHLTGHSAEDGSILWSCGDFNPEQKRNWVTVASAVRAGDLAIVPYGRGSQLAGVKLGGTGDVTESHRLWNRAGMGAFVPTPLVADGKLYVVMDGGEIECLDPQTGKTIWADRFPKHRSKFYASPVVADGKLYAPREDGVVLVAAIGDKFELLSENDMGEPVIASPVPVRGRLLIRGENHLFCIGSAP